MSGGDNGSNGNREQRGLRGVGLYVALVILVAFATFVWFMIGQRGADEPEWSRLAWLFASVEAVAFAAAGALFGSEVQRKQTERAEKKAEESSLDAENGRTLAKMLKFEGGSAATERGLEALGSPTAPGAPAARYAALATELFPDV